MATVGISPVGGAEGGVSESSAPASDGAGSSGAVLSSPSGSSPPTGRSRLSLVWLFYFFRGLTYKDSGVDIAAGNLLVKQIKPLARATSRPGESHPVLG